MIEAWLSSSEQMVAPAAPKVVSTPRLAAKPVGNSTAASVPRHVGQLGFELVVAGTGPDDEAGGARAGAPAVDGLVGRGLHRRVLGQAEVVVRRERHDRRPSVVADGEDARPGRRRRRARGARHWPGRVDHAGTGSSIHSAQAVTGGLGASAVGCGGGATRCHHGGSIMPQRAPWPTYSVRAAGTGTDPSRLPTWRRRGRPCPWSPQEAEAETAITRRRRSGQAVRTRASGSALDRCAGRRRVGDHHVGDGCGQRIDDAVDLGAVDVSIGMSTTTSPSGRSSTPRRTAPRTPGGPSAARRPAARARPRS